MSLKLLICFSMLKGSYTITNKHWILVFIFMELLSGTDHSCVFFDMSSDTQTKSVPVKKKKKHVYNEHDSFLFMKAVSMIMNLISDSVNSLLDIFNSKSY